MTHARPQRPAARQILKEAGVLTLLLTDLVNIHYLTGVELSAGALLVSKEGMQLFVDGRYLEAASSSAYRGVQVLPYQTLANCMLKLKKVGFESEQVTVLRYGIWKRKYKNTKFIQTSGVIAGFRRRKATDELQSIRAACAVTKSLLKRVPVLLKNGVTEKELAFRLECLAREAGAEGMAFESIIAFGENTARPHHRPTDRKLRAGDLVQVDMGVRIDGYCSDYSRVYFTGPATREQNMVLKNLLLAKKTAEDLVRPGADTRALDRAARHVLKSAGLEKEFCHALGHGVGLEIHEGVTIASKGVPKKLLKDEVITIEPGVYFEGRWGMRIEDTIIVR